MEFMAEALHIGGFEQPWSQGTMHLDSRTDDGLGDLVYCHARVPLRLSVSAFHCSRG